MTLAGHIARVVPLLDEYYSKREATLHERPLVAAIMYVEKFILDIKGDTKENYHEKPWFGYIYTEIEKWYRERYGSRMDENASGFATGVVLVRNIPVELRIPMTRTTFDKSDETVWLKFLIAVEDNEDVLFWLVNPPSLNHLDGKSKRKLIEDIKTVATLIRRLRSAEMGIAGEDEEVNGLIRGVFDEIEAAARNFVNIDANSRGIALWSLQMATERALKALSKQSIGSYRKTHNLFYIFDDIMDHIKGVSRDKLKSLPRHEAAVADRYGLGSSTSISDAMRAYRAALKISTEAIHSMKHELRFNGASIQIKRPPWTIPINADADDARASSLLLVQGDVATVSPKA